MVNCPVLPIRRRDLLGAIVPDPQGRRKVVLATNIAETSLTIEGVRVVVDSGWQRVPRFDPRSGLTRLERVRVSRASADQRAGRAGRLGPGACYRLWGEGTQRGLIPFNPPQIASADLAPLALELAQWGVADAAALRWLDAPPAGALAQGGGNVGAWHFVAKRGAFQENTADQLPAANRGAPLSWKRRGNQSARDAEDGHDCVELGPRLSAQRRIHLLENPVRRLDSFCRLASRFPRHGQRQMAAFAGHNHHAGGRRKA